MTRINLLPWREELTGRRRRYFVMFLLGIAGLALIAIWLADQVINQAIARQVARNNYLGNEVAVLEARIKTIDELQEQREYVAQRMKVVQALQEGRLSGGQLFDQLARAVPDGVRLREVVVTQGAVSINGAANSNHDIARLMRNLEAFEELQSTRLQQVLAEDKGGGNTFHLMVGNGMPGKVAQ